MNLKRLETLLEKVKEACMSVFPIALIILFLSFTVCPLPNDIFLAFAVGTCMLVVGLGLFSLGAEMSMERIGAHIGANLTRSRKIPIIAIISLIVGVLITICEPDLQVLNGRFGPYIAYDGNNYKLPKNVTPAEVTLEECMDIISKQQEGGKAPAKRRYTKKK